jgi:O-antigen ligase
MIPMTVLAARSTPDRSRLADWFWIAAHSILGSMPVVMAIAHRSSPLVLAVALAAALAAMLAEGRVRPWLTEAAAALSTPLGLAVLAFFAFAAVSIAWSDIPGTSAVTFIEFGLTIAGAFVLGLVLPRRMPVRKPLLLATSMCLACVLILGQLWTDVAARRLAGMRSEDFIFNRPSLTVLLLIIPLAWLLLRGGYRRLATVVLVLVGVTLAQSSSGASVLGLLAALGAYALARFAGRKAVAVMAGCLALAIMIAPVMGTIADRVLPSAVHDSLARANTRARVEIWKRFGEAVWQDPVLGAGFGVSPNFARDGATLESGPGRSFTVFLWHPHNAALQVWVELGAVGAMLGLIIVMLLLSRIARLPDEFRAVSLALLAAVAAVSLVGHGAWQGWWPAAIGAAVVWLRASHVVLRGSDDAL